LPLHGLWVVIEAMRLLKDQPIELCLIGGKKDVKVMVDRAIFDGVKLKYKTWVPFGDLPGYMQQADICLGGPFGETVQSQFVITGKTYQALQMGCPVIIGENLESGVFTDKKDTLIIKQANPLALSEAILWAKEHPIQLRKIGKAGKEVYYKKFSSQKLSLQLQLMLLNEHIL
jgi:glycosyltransferase involved in cell wall biosynthesis